jgi:hypothetical protein
MVAKATRVVHLEASALDVVERYRNLHLGGKRVAAPYYMNTPGRKGRRVSVGKGTAEALEAEVTRLAKKHNFNLEKATPAQIRKFMIIHKLGIDCSGLVAWISHALSLQHTGKALWNHIQFKGHPLRVFVVKNLRPVENISARLLTGETNAHTIHELSEVRPGDIIRSLNGNHVLLITEVGFNQDDVPVYLTYVNSTEYAGQKYGVRFGTVDITKPNGHILDQEWIDGENGVNWLFKAANDFPDDTRVVRLKALA